MHCVFMRKDQDSQALFFITAPVKLPWSVVAYSKKVPGSTKVPNVFDDTPPPLMSAKERERFMKFFDQAQLNLVDTGGIVVDRYGKIVLWHLPDIIHPARIVSCVLIHSARGHF